MSGMEKTSNRIKNPPRVKMDEFHVYLPPDIGKRMRKLASDERRKLNNTIMILIIDGLQKRGY